MAIVHTVLFLSGLSFVVSFSGGAHYPNPYDSPDAITMYFRTQTRQALLCAFLQFGSLVPLGIYVATVVSRLRFLGVKAAGSYIALFGGFLTVFQSMTAASILWVMCVPGVAQDAGVLRALYYMGFALGGPSFSVAMGLFIAGVSVTAGMTKLLPRWVVVFGLILAVIGELSWLNLLFPQAVLLIPLTRFPGFLWLIAVGFLLPSTVERAGEPGRA